MRGRNVAVPSGDIYPNGIYVSVPDPSVQATVHRAGTAFVKSPGFETVRIGRHKMQRGYHGGGIHFTPTRLAEDLGGIHGGINNALVDVEAAKDHADIANVPGSELMDEHGHVSQGNRILLAEEGAFKTEGDPNVARSHEWDLGDVREIDDEFVRYGRGMLLNPVDFLSDEYEKTPVKAVVIAGIIVSIIYMVGTEFERSYRRRKRRTSAPQAAVGAAGATAGATAGTAIETPGEVVEEIGEGIAEATAAVAEAVEDVTGAIADAVS